MMNKNIVLTTLAAGLVLGGIAFAGAQQLGKECSTKQECPTAKKVDELLVRWEAAQAKSRDLPAEAREELGVKLAGLAEKCPVGCRMNDTLAVVRDVLGVVVASSQANAENCPLEKAAESAACIAGKELKAARTQTVDKLHQLARHAASATSCSTKAAAASCVATVADEGAACCPIRIASRIGAMKASFADACREAEALTPETRGAIQASFASLGESSEVVTLVPASIEALAEGFQVLGQLHGKMAEWAQANPDVLGSLPESAHQSFMMEVALIDEANGLLASVTKAMKTMQSAHATTVGFAGSR